MTLNAFLSIAAVIGIVFGIGMLIVPEQVFELYAIPSSEGSKVIARSLGALIFSVGIMNWIARGVEDSVALRAILYGNLAIHLLTLVTDLLALTSGAMSAQGWGLVILHTLLGGGFAYFVFAKPTRS